MIKAYSITSAHLSNGVCITISGAPTTLSSAYTEILQSANGQIVLDGSGEQSFIDFLGFSTCSVGGENVAATALVQVTTTTATMTSTFSGVPLAAVSATLTIAPVSYHIPREVSQNDLLPMTAAVSEAGYIISAMIKIRCPCHILYHYAELFLTDITMLEICTIRDCRRVYHKQYAIDHSLSFSRRPSDCYCQQDSYPNSQSYCSSPFQWHCDNRYFHTDGDNF